MTEYFSEFSGMDFCPARVNAAFGHIIAHNDENC
jgi:hypothetical protein